MSAWPRGSWQSSRRTASISSDFAAAWRRSSTVVPGMSGTPAVTIRNGSPAVCQSVVRTARLEVVVAVADLDGNERALRLRAARRVVPRQERHLGAGDLG